MLSHQPRGYKDALWAANVQIILVRHIGDLSMEKGWSAPPPNTDGWGTLHGITDHSNLCAGITSQAGGAFDAAQTSKFAGQKKAYPRCWEFVRNLLSGYGVTVPKEGRL
jgi:hypothetical protein